jgi:hypothetical protein
MPKTPAHRPHGHTGGEHLRRCQMPEVVKPEGAQTRVFPEPAEGKADSIRSPGPPAGNVRAEQVRVVGVYTDLTRQYELAVRDLVAELRCSSTDPLNG